MLSTVCVYEICVMIKVIPGIFHTTQGAHMRVGLSPIKCSNFHGERYFLKHASTCIRSERSREDSCKKGSVQILGSVQKKRFGEKYTANAILKKWFCTGNL